VKHSATTLLELLAALAILSILSFVAIPGLSAWLGNLKMTSNVKQLIHSFHMARQNALTTGIATIVCSTSNGYQCQGASDWSDGWLVFANNDKDEPPHVDNGEKILETTRPAGNPLIFSNRRAYVLRPFGLRSTNGTITFCNRQTAAPQKAVIVSYTGKPRSSDIASGAATPDCLN